ncbi:hypothetical protein ABW21_db0208733 [Orbilia brochopaga]|nr:hypothetical protein ABW21_db0208733 [Drechslerella brochopaga]
MPPTFFPSPTPFVGYVIMALCLILFAVSLLPLAYDLRDAVLVAYAYATMLGRGVLAWLPEWFERGESPAFAEWADVEPVLPLLELFALATLIHSFITRWSRLAGEFDDYIGQLLEEFETTRQGSQQVGTAEPLHSAPQPRVSDIDELRRRLRSNDKQRSLKARDLRVREIRRSKRVTVEVSTQTECPSVCVQPFEIVVAVVAESAPEEAGKPVGESLDAGLTTATDHPAPTLVVAGIVDDRAVGVVAGPRLPSVGSPVNLETEEAHSPGDEMGDAQGHGGAGPEDEEEVDYEGFDDEEEAEQSEDEEEDEEETADYEEEYEEEEYEEDLEEGNEEDDEEEGEDEDEEDEDRHSGEKLQPTGHGGAGPEDEEELTQLDLEQGLIEYFGELLEAEGEESEGSEEVDPGERGEESHEESDEEDGDVPSRDRAVYIQRPNIRPLPRRRLAQPQLPLLLPPPPPPQAPQSESESESESEERPEDVATGERGGEQREEVREDDGVPEADRTTYIVRPDIRPLPRRFRAKQSEKPLGTQ